MVLDNEIYTVKFFVITKIKFPIDRSYQCRDSDSG